jgi:hypothetical protein
MIPGPDTRVVEIRVHGLLGTTAEELVDAVAAVDVAGDGVGRIVRPADRLRRPAPGPVLKADGRPLPRTVEGYVWGGMTSGGWAKAVWALLFPFSLANVASWMLPPVPAGRPVATVLGACCRALLRLAALLLTVLLVAQLAAVSFDLFATQCLAPGGRCLSAVPLWVRERAALRPLIGLIPLLLLVFVLGRVSRVNWSANTDTPVPPSDGPVRKLDGLPGARRIADPDAPALRTLHLTAALATVPLLALGGPHGPRGGAWTVNAGWWLAVGLLGATVLGVLLLDDPTDARPSAVGRWLLAVLSPANRRVLIGIAVVSVGLVAAVSPTLPAHLPGTDPTLAWIAAGLAGSCVLLGLLLIPAALLARSNWAALPGELRPWAGGWMAAPFMALAALLGAGFGAGVAITVRQALGGTPLALPHAYAYLTLLWGVAGALTVAGAVVAVLVVGVRRLLPGVATVPEATLLHSGRPADAAAAARAWRPATWERRHGHQVALAVIAVLVVGAAVSVVPWRAGQLPPAWSQPLSAVGLTVLTLLAATLLREVYAAARQPDSARHLGGLSDLCCFWPREAHPVVPPCYALKAVPEVAARAAHHLAEPNTRVVLAGHSQGSLIACAAATRLLGSLSADQARRLGVLAASSPIQWAYQRAFPAVVPSAGLAELYHDLDGRWRTLCRGTDPIGGGVTTWRRQVFDDQLLGVGFRVDGTSGALPAAVLGPTGALVLGGDHWLPDPERGPFPSRRWAPGVLGHRDYYSDPEWDRAVACAAGMESPDEITNGVEPLFRLPGRFSSTG